jgi:hypothetical protein
MQNLLQNAEGVAAHAEFVSNSSDLLFKPGIESITKPECIISHKMRSVRINGQLYMFSTQHYSDLQRWTSNFGYACNHGKRIFVTRSHVVASK